MKAAQAGFSDLCFASLGMMGTLCIFIDFPALTGV